MAFINSAGVRDVTLAGTINLIHFTCSGTLKCTGSAAIHDSQLNQITTSGATKITQSTANAIFSSGVFQASDCKFETANTPGSSSLTRCEIANELTASGHLHLTASKVQRAIFSGKEMKVFDSTIDELVVKEDRDHYWKIELFGLFKYESLPLNKQQRIELNGANCKVNTIRFEKTGTVLLKNGAAAPTVINGEVIVA